MCVCGGVVYVCVCVVLLQAYQLLSLTAKPSGESHENVELSRYHRTLCMLVMGQVLNGQMYSLLARDSRLLYPD